MSVILLLGGCATDSTLRPMTVSVRDGLTHRPVPGALVRVTSVHFHFPWPPFQKFDPIAHLASPAVTDENGVGRLGAYVNHPVPVIVTRGGGAPRRVGPRKGAPEREGLSEGMALRGVLRHQKPAKIGVVPEFDTKQVIYLPLKPIRGLPKLNHTGDGEPVERQLALDS